MSVMHELLSIFNPVMPSLVTGGLVLLGVVLTNNAKRKDQELIKRAQLLDIYKIIYPEKIKATTAIMNEAGAIYRDMHAWYFNDQTQEAKDAMAKRLRDLKDVTAKCNEALIGAKCVEAVGQFVAKCMHVLVRPSAENLRELKDNVRFDSMFNELTVELRNVLYLDEIDKQLRPTKHQPKV